MLIYIASPYTSYEGSRSEAYQQVCMKVGELMKEYPGYAFFCPIAHSHAIEIESDLGIQTGDWWLNQDFAILNFCDELWVYQLSGWDKSYGVGKEIEFALDHKITTKFLNYEPTRTIDPAP